MDALLLHEALTYESSSPCTPRLSTALISIFSSSVSAAPTLFSPAPNFSLCGCGSALSAPSAEPDADDAPFTLDGSAKKSCVSWSRVGSLKFRRCVDIVDILASSH